MVPFLITHCNTKGKKARIINNNAVGTLMFTAVLLILFKLRACPSPFLSFLVEY